MSDAVKSLNLLDSEKDKLKSLKALLDTTETVIGPVKNAEDATFRKQLLASIHRHAASVAILEQGGA